MDHRSAKTDGDVPGRMQQSSNMVNHDRICASRGGDQQVTGDK